MFELRTITPRVNELRQIYRETIPTLDAERVRIITDYYRISQNEVPIIRRAKQLQHILEKMTIRVEPNELIVANMATTFRGVPIWPEYGGIGWLIHELDTGKFDSKGTKDGFMYMSQEDRDYLHSVEDFWNENCISAKIRAALPEGVEEFCSTGVSHDPNNIGNVPGGHFNANYRKVIEKGFLAIKKEAEEKLAEYQGKIDPDNIEKYYFYRAIVISCDSAMNYSKRYAAECKKQAEAESDSKRKMELLNMADSLNWIMENPARSFHEALQVVMLYATISMLEGNYLGMTIGRMDQHVGDYLEADLASGKLSMDEAQELMDCFYLKIADLFFPSPETLAHVVGAYSNNLRFTIGGRKPDGTDATNEATYMCLQSSARLKLHDPTLSLGIHDDSPEDLLEAGIETLKIVSGIPCIENSDLITDMLVKRGLAIEDARNYCIVGCVEISGSGCDWSNVSGPFSNTWLSVSNVLIQAINNGVNPQNNIKGGLSTGTLPEMGSFEEVKEAFIKQLDYFFGWYLTINNIMEYVGYPLTTVPMASATMDGCMESGKDMMLGGAKYNSTGTSTIAMATAVDSLSAIKYMVFDKKLCSAQELYDAFMANWDGYEILRQRIMSEVPHFGNGDPYVDEIATWMSDEFTSRANSIVSARGGHRAGMYSAGAHVPQGDLTYATPNGRKNHEPLADSASPSQGCDVNGPTAVAKSILALHPYNYSNGLQFNMKLHPTSVAGTDGTEKLKLFIKSFIDQGGMQLQFNIVDNETLKKAKANPDDYKDLVVRVAGFSAYFVELYEGMQDDLIRRSEGIL